MSDVRAQRLDRKGFTLIEVVIALAILGVSLVAIIELFSGGLRLGRMSKEYTTAVNYARMKMEEISLKEQVEEGVEEGKFDDTFRWETGLKKVDIFPVEADKDFKPPTEFFHVKVNVTWKSGSMERSTTIESYKMIKHEEGEKKI
jgi:prepilin-type N-terminal cleavage/methylation domain-containing protein